MRLILIIFSLLTLGQSAFGQKSLVKITVNSQDVEINRFYYFDDFRNMIFLQEENEILMDYSHLQIIDGKNDISYILNPGDDIEIPFSNENFVYFVSKNNTLRTKELRYSVDQYHKFRTTFLNETSIPKCYMEPTYIENTSKRDSLIWGGFNQEIEFLKKYKNHEGLSDEFYQTHYDFLKSIFMDRYLLAFYVPFSNEYLQSVLPKSFNYLNSPDLLYLSSFKNALINYARIYNKLRTSEAVFDKHFQEEIQAFVIASDIVFSMEDDGFAIIKQEEKETYIHDFLQDCKISRFCDYIHHNMLKRKLSDQQLLDQSLNYANFEDIVKEGKTYLIFWASWCGPCIKSIKETGAVRDKLMDKGINIVFVSIDRVVQDWQRAIEKLRIEKYPHYNMNGNSELNNQLGIYAVPHYKLFKDGEILLDNLDSLSDSSTVEKLLSME